MRGASTLIPARFLTLIGHLCVLVTLLWESQQSARHCLPSQHHKEFIQIYHSRLVAGFAAAIAFIIIELTTFILGLTMFSPSVSLISIAGHGSAAILLSYFVLDGWLCDWYWPIFSLCSVLPAIVDMATALLTICSTKCYAGKGTSITPPETHTPCSLMDFYKVTTEHQHLTESHEYKPGWSFYLVLAGIATTLGSSLPVGFNIGVVNTPAALLKNFCNESIIAHYDVVLDEQWLNFLWAAVVSIFIVGGCTGSILGAVMADYFGRKKATIAISGLWVVGALLFGFCRAANSVEMLILGRLVVGLSGGLTTSIVPMYLTELAPLSLTGAMGVACPMGVNVGVLVGQVMGLKFLLGGADDWPYLLSVYVLLVIFCLPLLFILPESPKYLYVVKRNQDGALKELSRLRGVSTSLLAEELDSLREESRACDAAALSGSQRWSMLRVLRAPRLRLPLLLACSMQAGQQTSGINAVFYYSQTIFTQAGLNEANSQYATIACGFINVCTAVAMLFLLPKVGRRPLLLGSILAAAAILAGLAASMKFMAVVSWMPFVCMAAVLAYVLVYGFGLGPIPYFIASEIFEVGPRPAGMAWGSLANWGGNFLVGMSFPAMRDSIGPYSFLVFSAVTAMLFVFQKMYFPETRGKTPAEITQLCSRGLRSAPLRPPPRTPHAPRAPRA